MANTSQSKAIKQAIAKERAAIRRMVKNNTPAEHNRASPLTPFGEGYQAACLDILAMIKRKNS